MTWRQVLHAEIRSRVKEEHKLAAMVEALAEQLEQRRIGMSEHSFVCVVSPAEQMRSSSNSSYATPSSPSRSINMVK